ncbi:hypothetical protein [Intestinimonas sp.]|uniref:hypothetical protein n=1 Tax=Intestinimonas sp. TaxID=1965293 RepID=UPI00262138CB|nr:hypothetical protein [Intestinimonas sp.]
MKIVDMTNLLNLSYQLFYFLRLISLDFGENSAFPVLQAPFFILSDCHMLSLAPGWHTFCAASHSGAAAARTRVKGALSALPTDIFSPDPPFSHG